MKAIRPHRTGVALLMGATPALLAGVLILTSAGCSYHVRPPFPQNVRTVYVEMFQSREFRRNLEFSLTEAVQKRILQDTPYRIADKQQADTLLSGEILEVRQSVLGREFRTGTPREQTATFVIRFSWKDLRTGQVLVDRPRFIQSVEYIPPVGEDFYQASVRGVDELAEQIVQQMMESW